MIYNPNYDIMSTVNIFFIFFGLVTLKLSSSSRKLFVGCTFPNAFRGHSDLKKTISFSQISSIHRPTWTEMDKELLKQPLDGCLPQRREGAHLVGEGANSEQPLSLSQDSLTDSHHNVRSNFQNDISAGNKSGNPNENMTMHVDLLMEVNIPMSVKPDDLLNLVSKARANREKTEAVFKKYADLKESKKLQKMRHELALKENHLVHLQAQSKDESSVSSL
jgi:hypothetical protein